MPVFQLMREYGMVIDWSDFIQPVLSYYSKNGRLYWDALQLVNPNFVLQQRRLPEGWAQPR